MTYDDAGNMSTKTDTTAGTKWTYGYNNANQMTSATEATTGGSPTTLESVTYEYDAFGNLMKESVTPYVSGVAGTMTTTEFAVDGWNPATRGSLGDSGFDTWAIMNSSGSLQTRNIYGNGIDQYLARSDNATNGAADATGIYWLLTDKQGSVRYVLDNTANDAPVDKVGYNAWGQILSQTGSTYLGRYGFDSYDTDAATGFDLVNARVYDPELQQWISQDPKGFAAGDSNLRRYVNNSPVNGVDRSGFIEQQPAPAKKLQINNDYWNIPKEDYIFTTEAYLNTLAKTFEQYSQEKLADGRRLVQAVNLPPNKAARFEKGLLWWKTGMDSIAKANLNKLKPDCVTFVGKVEGDLQSLAKTIGKWVLDRQKDIVGFMLAARARSVTNNWIIFANHTFFEMCVKVLVPLIPAPKKEQVKPPGPWDNEIGKVILQFTDRIIDRGYNEIIGQGYNPREDPFRQPAKQAEPEGQKFAVQIDNYGIDSETRFRFLISLWGKFQAEKALEPNPNEQPK